MYRNYLIYFHLYYNNHRSIFLRLLASISITMRYLDLNISMKYS